MSTMKATIARRPRGATRSDTILGVVLGLLVAVATLAMGASVDTTAYGNNDVIVNTISSGSMVVMVANMTPSTFDPYNFVAAAYPLYAAANPEITSLNKVVMVGWCAQKSAVLNTSFSCQNGSKYDNSANYPYVFIQMCFPSWNSTTVLPQNVDLSSLKVISQQSVKSFAGIYDPDKNTSFISSGYIKKISGNTAAVYAVFGVLLGGVVIAIVITCVCICRRDNAMASVNKGIVDKVINSLRSGRDKSRSNGGSAPGANSVAGHYNFNGDTPSSAAVMPATAAANLGPREGSNTYPSPMDSRMAEREMQEIKARQMVSPDTSNLQKPPL